MLQILLSIIIGIILGTISGLTPGIHMNLVSIIILTIYSKLSNIDPIIAASVIISMSITHTFLDFIPSTYLGAPTDETILNVLPSHKYLLQGKAYEAVKLSIIGSYLGLLQIILITPLLIPLIPILYTAIEPYIPYILIILSITLILKDQEPLKSLIIFLLAGSLGYITLNLKNLQEPLFPLFSGLFGTSSILLSLKDKIQIPKQFITSPKLKLSKTIHHLNLGLISSLLTGFLPGLGAAQAATISSALNKENSDEYYILLTGSINTVVMVLSIVALYTIQKSRNGAILVISKIIPNLNLNTLILLITIALITASITTNYSLYLAKQFSNYITKINYQLLSIAIVIFIIFLTIIISKPLGLLILIISTFLGFLPVLTNIPRNQLMGSLLIPVILYYF